VSLIIKYVAECNCGGTMSCTELDLSQEPGGKVEVNLDMLGDVVIECDTCHDRAFVPDLSDYITDID
jgi:hypothetical protein